MKDFYVMLHNYSKNEVEKYNIMPYLISVYEDCKDKEYWWMFDDTNKGPCTKEEFTAFVKRVCKYQFWARCEYEWLMIGWPPGKTDTLEDCQKIINSSIKVDAYTQIEMNLDVIADIFRENVEKL